MGKSTPSAPAAPDPYATASAQGTSNANTATAQTALNNANVYSPYGSTTFQVTGSQQITNPDGSTTSVPTYSEQQTLSAPQQAILNQNNSLALRTNNIASAALGQIGTTLANPIQQSQLTPLTTSVGATPSLASSYDPGGQIQTSVEQDRSPTEFGQTAQAIQGQIGNTAGAVQYGLGNTDFTADRDAATNAALARLQPQMDRDNSALQAQLANQGISVGSSAYGAAQQQQSAANNDLRLGAVQTGDQEQQALFGERATANQLYNAAQQQDFGQQEERGNFANAAQQQDYAQQLGRGEFAQAGVAANNASALAAGTFANAAQGQQNSENAAAAAFGNTAASQDYQNRLAGGAFSNSAAAQQLQQLMGLQNQQINEISALRSGGQVTGMQSPNYSAGTLDQTPISSDVYATAGLQNQQYLAQLQNSAQNNAAFGSALGGLAGGIGRKSDRRLKSEIARVATARNGLAIYRYRMAGEVGWHVGMMADEVALVHPEAVWTDPDDGWARVDYEKAVL